MTSMIKNTDFDRIAERLRNWGRWGAEDQRGTLNHIDPAALCRASAEVRNGKQISLGLSFDRNGLQTQTVGPTDVRLNPRLFVSAMGFPLDFEGVSRGRFNDDVVHMSLQCATHWDAFSHIHYDGKMYNGFDACTVTALGAAKCGVEHLANPGIASRGVLLDIAELRGVDQLPGDVVISPDDLDAACAKHGIRVEPGDIVIVRTGHMRTFLMNGDREGFAGSQPGLSGHCAEWLYDRSAAAVASDNYAVEALNAIAAEDETVMPLHLLCLRDMGMPLGENFNLEALAADCRMDGRYTFMLAAPPLAFTNAFGSPVNPMAFK